MKKKDKKLLKVLLVFFVVFSMLLSDCTPVLAATIDAASELAQNIEEQKNDSAEEVKGEAETVEVEAENTEEKIETEAVEVEAGAETETKLNVENNKFVVSADVDEPATETIKTISKMNAQYTSADGNTYEVTVSYGKDSNIPENAKLQVKEFAKDTDEYNNAYNAVLTNKQEKGEDVNLDSFNMVALDISIIDANGNEIEPDASVSVEMNIKSLTGIEDLSEVVDSIEIQHHVEEQGKTTIDYVEDNYKYNAYKKSIETKFDVESFSTFTIKWDYYGERETTVHYGYMENETTFKEFDNQPSPVSIAKDDENNAYLIYDFDGYHYSGNTYYRTDESSNPSSDGSTEIYAMLRYHNGGRWDYDCWQYHSTANYSDWNDIANNSHIYVVYDKNPEIYQGGSPTIKKNTETPEEPELLKESEDNEDGTRTLSLSITGDTVPLEVDKLADVIVVFDVSGSMNDDMDGHTTYNNNNRRITIAKNAVNKMAETLSEKKNSNGDKLIRMGLISFSTSAKVVQELTDDYGTDNSDFNSAVRGLGTGGGTNWEYALQLANQMEVDSGRKTFVIFVSDGDPTFRVSRMDANDSQIDLYNKNYSGNNMNNDYYLSDNVFGEGSNDNAGRNYDAALAQAQAIVGANKDFYTIAISNDVDNMATLNEDAGGKDNYTARTSAELENAFNDIINNMQGTLGYSAGIVDGVTNLTNVTYKPGLVNVDKAKFKYYRKAADEEEFKEWDPTSVGANTATFDNETGCVKWDLGSNFQLEDGVTYKVSFIVWPSQTAIDYVTDLYNGLITYNSLPDDVKAQIYEDPENPGNYLLRTNTDEVYVSYQLNQKMNDGTITPVADSQEQKSYFKDNDKIGPLKLDTMKLKFEKIFTDTLTEAEDRDTFVVLNVKYREIGNNGEPGEWKNYNAFQDFTYTVYTKEEAQAAGDETLAGTIKEVNYKVDANGNPIYNNRIILYSKNDWKTECFISPGLETVHGSETIVYNPGYEFMLEEPDIDYHYELNSEIVKPMLVNLDKKYLNSDGSEGNEFLTAENIVKGGIDVKKVLTDQDGNEITDDDTVFIIKGKIVDKEGNPYTFNNAEWDTRTDKSTGEGAPEIWKQHQNDTGAYHSYDANGNQTGYKLHFDSTDNIVLELKAGERVRFINVPKESKFEFYEDTASIEDGYKFVEIAGKNTTVPATTEVEDQPTVKDGKVTGDVYGNVNHSITVTNKVAYVEATFEGTKDIDNRDLTEDDIFTFEVVNNANPNEKWEVENDATGKINYPTIRYTKTGTYTYTVKETSEGGSGITPDTKTYTVTVNVTEENGKLVAHLSDNATHLDFMNMYDAIGDVTFEGTKTLTGRDMTADDVFNFEIAENNTTNTWTATSDASGKINYPKISYTIADTGTHTYTVKETSEDGDGITVATNSYTVTVNVTDNGDGTLKVEASDNSKALNFTNTYGATGSVTFEGKKTIDGRDMTADDVFTFEIKENGTDKSWTATNDAEGTIAYPEISYTLDDLGEHTYTVKETSEDGEGITVAKNTYTVTVNVTDNGDGTLKVEASDNAKALNFVNTYAATGDITFAGTKTLTGRKMTANDKFNFEVKENGTDKSWTATNDATTGATTGKINYPKIEYTLTDVGMHKYTVTETSTDGKGITVDTNTYEVSVAVSDNGDGTLEVIATDNSKALNFENKYAAEGDITFEGTKTLEGRKFAEKDVFTFTVLEDGTEVATGTIEQQGTDEYTRTINYTTINYTLDDLGEHTYTVKETSKDGNGITVDTKSYTVTVTVSDNGDGTLKVEASDNAKALNFVNKYKATGETTFVATKALTGKDLEKDEFSFKLTDENNKEIETVKNDEYGYIKFSTINYTEKDIDKTYTYYITEVNDGKDGYRYDNMKIKVTVTITDNLDGTLIVDVSKVDDSEFNNIYETVNVDVLKVWYDRDNQDGIQPDDIEVILKANGKEIDRVTLSADEDGVWYYAWEGLVKHSNLVDINYTVEEVVPEGYEAFTESEKDENGNVSYLINNYHQVETVDITTVKVWEDYDNNDGYRPDHIEVTLKANGEEVETVTLNEENNWTYTWEELDKNAAGEEIEYTVEEVEVPYMYTVEYSVDEDGTFVVTNTQIPGEGGYEPEEEIPAIVNPSTGMNIIDSFSLYIVLIVGAIVFVVIETKRINKR